MICDITEKLGTTIPASLTSAPKSENGSRPSLPDLALNEAGRIEALVKTVTLNRYIRQTPEPPQRRFLALLDDEALYGGAAGGGKSSALLMAALQYIHVPDYSAIIFRRTYQDLSLPGALIDRAHAWLDETDARWVERLKTWVFPSGATMAFGYLEHLQDRLRYQGAEFQFVGFDELTQFEELSYRYLFSRLRRLEGSPVPIRMRAASNPGGIGHDWVRARFIDGACAFVPARLTDNPHLDGEEYRKTLNRLDPVTRQQLLDGNWEARELGKLFRRNWFSIVERTDVPVGAVFVRFWDMAATDAEAGRDPDWTAGELWAMHEGRYWVVDVERFQASPAETERRVRATAQRDGYAVAVRMEQEPGSSGKIAIDHYARYILPGYDFKGVRSTGDKVERARPMSAAAEQGNIRLVRGGWVSDFLDEYEIFPAPGVHDDQVDGGSGALSELQSVGECFVA